MHATRHRDHTTRSIEAIAHPARLSIFRIVTAAGSDGVASGEIARRAGLSAANTSHHLSWLADAGLLVAERVGRSVVYRSDASAIRSLLDELGLVLGVADAEPAAGPAGYGRGIGVAAVRDWIDVSAGGTRPDPTLSYFRYHGVTWRGAGAPAYREVKVGARVTAGPGRIDRRRTR